MSTWHSKSSELPTLFKYTKRKWGLRILDSMRLFVCDPWKFPDVSELTYFDARDKPYKDPVFRSIRVCCLSYARGSDVMWEKYGDEHHGCCIVFNHTELSKFVQIQKVYYKPRSLQATIPPPLTRETLSEVLCTKTLGYQWEKEARILYATSTFESSERKGHNVEIDSQCIEWVICGIKMRKPQVNEVTARAREHNIPVRRAFLTHSGDIDDEPI